MKSKVFLLLLSLSLINAKYLWIGNYTNQSYSLLNISFEGKNYALIKLGNNYLLWNYSSKDYVVNSTVAFNVIKGYYVNISQNLIQQQKQQILAQINSFVSGFWKSFYDCYSLLGLTSGLSCTVANWCLACTSVPSCNAYINPIPNVPGSGSGGQIFVVWASIFASDSQLQNQSITNLRNSIATLNYSNFANNIQLAQNSISLLSKVMRNMTLNGILNMSPTRYDTFGYCLPINYNRTLFSSINSSINSLASQVYTTQKIQNIANNIANSTEQIVIIPQQQKDFAKYQEQFSLINRNYTNAVANATMALKIFKFDLLQKTLNALKANFSYYNSTISNVSQAHAVLRGLINKINEESALIFGLSQNINSSLNSTLRKAFVYYADTSNASYLTKLQNISSSLASATYENAAISYMKILNYSNTLNNLLGKGFDYYIKLGIKRLFGFGRAFSRNIYLSNTISLAVYSLFIAIIAIAVAYSPIHYFNKLKKKRKIKVNLKTKRSWYTLFAIVSLIVVVIAIYFIFLGYSLTTRAPYPLFEEELSKKAMVLVATDDYYANNCASAIANKLNASLASINPANGVCNIGNQTLEQSRCLETSPTIILELSNSTKITPVSFASSYLIVQGNSTFYSLCYISKLLR